MSPITDIIILVHNNLSVTKDCIEHIFANTRDFNLIIVDNGSTDSVVPFLQDGDQNHKWKLIRSDENIGVIGGRNLGAKFTTADFFVNLDNDQYVQSGWLESLYSVIDRGNDISGVEAWCLLPPNSRGVLSINGKSYSRDYYPYKHCQNKKEQFSYIGCGGMLIKRRVYEHIGLFDERFNPMYFEDPDFCYRAIQTNYRLGWCCNCPIQHLKHQTSPSFNKNEQFVKSLVLFQEKWRPYYPALIQ